MRTDSPDLQESRDCHDELSRWYAEQRREMDRLQRARWRQFFISCSLIGGYLLFAYFWEIWPWSTR